MGHGHCDPLCADQQRCDRVRRRGTENITDQDILRQISWIEDDLFRPWSYRSGLDRYKDDRGTRDGVVWVLSPAQ